MNKITFKNLKRIAAEVGEKIPDEKKAPIEAALKDLKEAHQAQDIDRIDTAMAAMNTAWQAASQEMYQATQEAQGGAGPQAEPTADAGGAAQDSGAEDVQDVEYEEVDETK